MGPWVGEVDVAVLAIPDSNPVSREVVVPWREFKRFYGHAWSLKRAVEEAVYKKRGNGERGKITQDERDELDRGMWEYVMKASCAVAYMQNQAPSASIIELIQCAPASWRKAVSDKVFADDKGPLIKWFMEYKNPKLDLIEPSVSLDHICNTDLAGLLELEG